MVFKKLFKFLCFMFKLEKLIDYMNLIDWLSDWNDILNVSLLSEYVWEIVNTKLWYICSNGECDLITLSFTFVCAIIHSTKGEGVKEGTGQGRRDLIACFETKPLSSSPYSSPQETPTFGERPGGKPHSLLLYIFNHSYKHFCINTN